MGHLKCSTGAGAYKVLSDGCPSFFCIWMTFLARSLCTEGDSHSSLPQSSLELIKSNLQEDNADEVNNMNSVFWGRALKAHWALSTCCTDVASDTRLKAAPSSLKADFIDPLTLTGTEEEGTIRKR